ncbi:hypothetical protein KEM56_001771 [Ascosphaera pollenicola]|nr:hypothetical protein KEM56_001771 [Ascosphaera pollenicola]
MAPRSVEEITRQAGDFEFDARIPIKYWFRTAGTLIKELVLVHLAGHPEAKIDTNRKVLRKLQNEVKQNLAKMESMKPRITKRHERYMEIVRQREHTRSELQRQQQNVALPGYITDDSADASDATRFLEPAENKELAVQLAQREFHRRTALKTQSYGSRAHGGEDLSKSIQRLGQQLHSSRTEQSRDNRLNAQQARLEPTSQSTALKYNYPSVPSRQTRLEPDQYLVPIKPTPSSSEARIAPPLPAKITEVQRPHEVEAPPPIPGKVSHAEPAPEKGPSPTDYVFKPSAMLEGGEPLRSVFISPEVRRHFIKIAAPNTSRNLETCGILCGSLVSNAFFISRLIIPEQEATSDTCEMVNESAVFDYCDADDLIVIGWIHTHPTQTCFMSSRDLHTHSGFQVMLKESIAIVCAPSQHPDHGFFRLTSPPGLQHVLSCTQPGIFHPHSIPNLYTDALRPAGHVYEAMGLDFEVVDLRP